MKKLYRAYKPFTIMSIILFLLFLALIYKLTSTRLKEINSVAPLISITPTIHFTRYQSSFLKISFLYPSNFQLEEIHNSIYIKGQKGKLLVDRIGSYFETIDEHLDQLERLNKVQVTDRKKVQINGLSGIKAVITHPNSKDLDTISYYFLPEEWTVYSISTDSKELEKDLDKIAESFKFFP